MSTVSYQQMNSITTRTVLRFTLEGGCDEMDPCAHDATIVLSDGRSKRVGLDGYEVHGFLKVIPKERIVNTFEKGHFRAHLSVSEFFRVAVILLD